MIDYLLGGAVLLILACFVYANYASGRRRPPLVGSDSSSATGFDVDFTPPIDADADMDHHHDHGGDHGGHHGVDFDMGGGHHHGAPAH